MDKMINAMIEDIYNEFVRKGDYLDLPETMKASDTTYKTYWGNPKFENDRFMIESAIRQECIANERQGFIYGFRKAMELFSQKEKSPL